MSINEIILYIMIIFMVLGAIDKIIGNKFGLGEQFEAGFNAMGALALSMIGIICLAPVIAALLKPIIVPIYMALGADPAMFATTILANDMGGAPLALEFAQDINAGKFSAFIVGAMMGPTIVFSIPVAIGIINKEDQKYLALGIASGMITIPIGAFCGGLAAGYGIVFLIKNLIPIIIVSILLTLGLIFIRDILKKIAHENGVAVFVSSHILSEMELMCDRVAVLDNGKIVKIEEIHGEEKEAIETVELRVKDREKAIQVLKEKFALEAKKQTNCLEVTLATEQVPSIIKELVTADVEIQAVIPKEHSLEEIFFDATKGGNENA